MTNNSRRTAAQVDKANPRPDNKDGHILEIMEEGNDAGAICFRWTLFLVCGDPKDPSTFFAGYPRQYHLRPHRQSVDRYRRHGRFQLDVLPSIH